MDPMDSADPVEPVVGTKTFQVAGDAYDAFMGRYSRQLCGPLLDLLGAAPPMTALDVGCGPGAMTGELARRLGATSVAACDPSPPFLAACAARHPDVDARLGPAEQLPFDSASFDLVVAQLILHFVSDPDRSVQEMARVARPGGVVGACQWATGGGMELIRRFWDAALVHDPDAPVESHLRFGGAGELHTLFDANGLVDVVEGELDVTAEYADFDELWGTFLLGVGPAGVYCAALATEQRAAVRHEMYVQLGEPTGTVALGGAARWVRARTRH